MSHQALGLRAWQFHVNDGKDYLPDATDRAIAEARHCDITHFGFGTNALCNSSVYTNAPVPPCRNWVLCGLSFRDFPRLARHDVLLDFVTDAEVPLPNLTAYPGRPLIVIFNHCGGTIDLSGVQTDGEKIVLRGRGHSL